MAVGWLRPATAGSLRSFFDDAAAAAYSAWAWARGTLREEVRRRLGSARGSVCVGGGGGGKRQPGALQGYPAIGGEVKSNGVLWRGYGLMDGLVLGWHGGWPGPGSAVSVTVLDGYRQTADALRTSTDAARRFPSPRCGRGARAGGAEAFNERKSRARSPASAHTHRSALREHSLCARCVAT